MDVCEEYIAFDLCWGCYGREAGRCSNLSLKRPELSCRLQTSFQHTHTNYSHMLTDGTGQLGNVRALSAHQSAATHPDFG